MELQFKRGAYNANIHPGVPYKAMPDVFSYMIIKKLSIRYHSYNGVAAA